MARIVWTMRAADEFAEAIEYVERQAPAAARRLAQRMMQRIRSLRRFPQSGGFVPEDDSQRYREVIEGNYRIIYRLESDAVVVMSIYHAARLLRSEDLP
ncbi:MAG: type II toxin-antitoxin system RelE/ParE family toxin [Pirellulaceae bacterium]